MVGVTGIVLGVIITCSRLVFTLNCMMELRRRKNKRDTDDISFTPSSSQSDDADSDDDLDEESKAKRQTEGKETKSKKRNPSTQGPHQCRFCPEVFALSQALGGHMNKHRSEKELEEVQKARALIAKKQPYNLGSSWNMPGGGDGNPYGHGGTPLGNSSAMDTSSRTYFDYYNQPAPTLQTSQTNQVLAALQNGFSAVSPLQGRGYAYSPVDNSRLQVYGLAPQGIASPAGQYQPQHGPEFWHAAGQQHPGVLQGWQQPVQPQHGTGVFRSNQGGLQDIVNMASHNQQGQSRSPMPSFIHTQPGASERTQFVDEHGNPAPDHLAGHMLQMPQEYTQTSVDQNLGTSFGSLRSEVSSIGSEHNQAPGHGAFGMPSLDGNQGFQRGADQNTILMESGHAGFDTDIVADHD